VGVGLSKVVVMKMLRDDAQATCFSWVTLLVQRTPDLSFILSGATPSARSNQDMDEAGKDGDIYRYRIWDKAGNLVFGSERLISHRAPKSIAERYGEQAADSLLSGHSFNEVHSGKPPEDTDYFVQSYIPIEINGTVMGVAEVYLDQTDNKGLYERSLTVTESIVAILVLVAGGLPGYMVYCKMRDHRVAEAEALFLADHDSLTGVPNRKRLKDAAKGALASCRRNKSYVAALMIDLDRFKDINDSFGHGSGDELLKAVALRLSSSIRDEDLVARLGGDEFVVLQVDMAQPTGASSLAERLIEILSEPYEINGTQLACGASIGVAIAPTDANEWESLLSNADAALYKSKTGGRNAVSFFEAGMDATIRERRCLDSDLRRALETNSFQLAYQPLFRFRDDALLGFEALLRWPEGWPPQSPAVFIPVAEESGLINPIGAWILKTACMTAANWANPLKIAVNLSSIQFRHGDIVSVVEEALRCSGLDPGRLELEVTESLWLQDTDAVLDQLRRLRRIGVSIALDDFGTGYSSLTYLWKFPFDTVKIDRSFVMGMEVEPKAAAIVNTIVALGKTLDLTITAEGVETPAQARVLKDAGCDQAQGFLYGRPLPVASANELANADPAIDLSTRYSLPAAL